jgi:hypothetical protein
MNGTFDHESLRALSPAERRQVLRELVDIERQAGPRPGTGRKWELLLVALAIGCVVLAGWIGYLVVSLPPYYRAGSWRGAWVGFDIGLLAAFAATAWAAWRRRQLLILALVVLATLLVCDAWFDVVLDTDSSGFWQSLASALILELPVAAIAIAMARRLLHVTIGQVMRYEGLPGKVPPLWRIPLLGPTDQAPLRRLLRVQGSVDPPGAPSDTSQVA